MLLPGQDGARARIRYERESSTQQPRSKTRCWARKRLNYAAADLGRRPRRATAWPGIFPAHASHRSACFEPRRASVKLMRITAPFASSTSLPQLSHTSLVTRATDFLLEFGAAWGLSLAKALEIRLQLSPAEFSRSEAGSRGPVLPGRGRCRGRVQHANVAGGNLRSFCRRDTGRSRQG
jgi:hypothetical protein